MSRFQRPLATMARSFSTSSAKNNKVAVMGASGGKPETRIKTRQNPKLLFLTSFIRNWEILDFLLEKLWNQIGIENWGFKSVNILNILDISGEKIVNFAISMVLSFLD